MKQHRWAKEIKAWADGAEIESKLFATNDWQKNSGPDWDDEIYEFRIKPTPKPLEPRVFINKFTCTCGKEWNLQPAMELPTPKEPQYLYVYADLEWDTHSYKLCRRKGDFGTYIGKIKLEQDDE